MDNSTPIDIECQNANTWYNAGWKACYVFMVEGQKTIHQINIDDAYGVNKYGGAGFEDAVFHYERNDLDEPESSDDLWKAFNAAR